MLAKLRLIDKQIAELDDLEYRKLLRLNFGERGCMKPQLRALYTRSGRGRVVALFSGDTVISWALIFSSYKKGRRTAYFYTRARYRSHGYGTMVAKHIKKKYRNIEVCPHDQRAKAFFRKTPFMENPFYT